MNPIVHAQLTAFSGENSSSALNETKFFEVYSIYSITIGILTDNVDPFKAHLRGDEFGLDGVTLLVEGELCTNTDEVMDDLAFGKNHSVEFGCSNPRQVKKPIMVKWLSFLMPPFHSLLEIFLRPLSDYLI